MRYTLIHTLIPVLQQNIFGCYIYIKNIQHLLHYIDFHLTINPRYRLCKIKALSSPLPPCSVVCTALHNTVRKQQRNPVFICNMLLAGLYLDPQKLTCLEDIQCWSYCICKLSPDCCVNQFLLKSHTTKTCRHASLTSCIAVSEEYNLVGRKNGKGRKTS